ncbi:MAG: hypothetical protein ACE5JG_06845 [Planctomycetota bacterium]
MLTLRALKAIYDRRRNGRLSREQLAAKRLARFRKLAAFVRERSPFYAEVIGERGIQVTGCRPGDFPVLRKDDLIERFDDIVTVPEVRKAGLADFLARSTDPNDLYRRRYHVLHSSGTSGQVCYAVFSRGEWIRGTSHFEKIVRLGLRKRLAFVGATGGHFAGVSLALSANRGASRLSYHTRAFDITRPTLEIVAGLNAFRPRVLIGYTGALRILGELQQRGELRIAPRVVVSSGEALGPGDRRALWEAFGAGVANLYASTEFLTMATPLPHRKGTYLAEDDLVFELHDDHTCVTSLFQRTMPLIRYRMEDVLVPDPETQDPQVPYLKVRDVVGRREDAPVFTNRDGRDEFIHPIVLAELYIPGLAAFQFGIHDKTSFTMRAQLERGLDDTGARDVLERTRRWLEDLLARKKMGNVRFAIEPVRSLGVDAHSGKFRLIVHERAPA